MTSVLPSQNLPWPLPYNAVIFIAQKEDCYLKAYLCPAGVWTCGWGETDGVTPTTEWSQDFADRRFCDSLAERVNAVKTLCTRTPTPMQLSAMVSLAYNIGLAGFAKSTVLRQHNAGDYAAAARAFALWNKITDPKTKKLVESNGLTQRRRAEAVMYGTEAVVLAAEPMPQAVAPESTIAASPIAKSGALTAAIGALTMLKDQADVFTGVSGLFNKVATDLSLQPTTLLGGALLVAGLVVVVHRIRQRSQGWA